MDIKEIKNSSIKVLWKVSFPLMISYFSTVAMLFIDRLFLSFYSPLALNAAASSGTLAWAFLWGWCTLANMAEIFVAQYNGAKRFDKIGEPVWQMVWLGIFTIVFYLSVGYFGGNFLYGNQENGYQLGYFRWMMYMSPFFVVSSGLSAFYIGQGKTYVIKWLAVLSNLVNVILDPILIFGIKGFIPSLGVRGAAIATGLGMAVQCIILFYMILRKKNQECFGSRNWSFKPLQFWKIVKIGAPPAIFVTLELVGWAIFFTFMALMSPQHILVSSVCQSILILFFFFGLGLEKGVAAVAGNLIGAKRINEIKKLMKSGVVLILLFSVFLAFFFFIYPHPLINWFFHNTGSMEQGAPMQTLTSDDNILRTKSLIRIGLIPVFFYLLLENIRWVLSGILTAAGDTFFLLISGSLSVWLFLIAPTYFFIVKTNQSVVIALVIWVAYSLIATAISFSRFLSGKWKEKHVIEAKNESSEILPSSIEETLS